MGVKLSTFELLLCQRPYFGSPSGAFRSERNYFDFVIGGSSLKERAGYDLVSVLCREWNHENQKRSVRRLLLEEPADFGGNRRSVLVCAECGGLDCGAVSMLVDISDQQVIWHDFGYQNDYEAAITGEHLKQFGPFAFDLAEYREKLSRALQMLKIAR